MALLIISPKSEPAQKLISRAATSEAHHHSVGLDAGRNSGGRRIIIKSDRIFLNINCGTTWNKNECLKVWYKCL